jgi:hypothetical protein
VLWAANGWGGDKAWRVEYQCRRDLLRELCIETIEELDANLAGTWGYLSRSWFRLKEVGENGRVWPRGQDLEGSGAEESRESVTRAALDRPASLWSTWARGSPASGRPVGCAVQQ